MYLIGMLVLLFLANVAMLMGMTNWPQRTREGFADAMGSKGKLAEGMNNIPPYAGLNWASAIPRPAMISSNSKSGKLAEGMDNIAPYMGLQWGGGSLKQGAEFRAGSNPTTVNESFMDYMTNGFATDPIGSYDGINLGAKLPPDSQGFRARLPNVPHPKVTIDGDHLLPFVNNVCKPECCGSTMSCNGGGCVCTTPEDRDLINTRGGNRRHEDGF